MGVRQLKQSLQRLQDTLIKRSYYADKDEKGLRTKGYSTQISLILHSLEDQLWSCVGDIPAKEKRLELLHLIKEHHPDLYNEMFEWVLKNHPIEGKKPDEVFGRNGKNAIKIFFDRIYAMSNECKKEIEEESYRAAMEHIGAFNSRGTASIVRKFLKDR